jgi:hypothetical protein
MCGFRSVNLRVVDRRCELLSLASFTRLSPTDRLDRPLMSGPRAAVLILARARALLMERRVSQATMKTSWAPRITRVTSTAGFHSQSP